MSGPLDILSMDDRKWMRRRAQPEWINPMLATLVREQFSDPEWIFEPKFDGIRCLAFRKGSQVELYSRNRLPLNDGYRELVAPLLKQSASSRFIVDGEIAAFERGVTRFSALQKRKQTGVSVFYCLFDLLYWDGYDLTGLKLARRKDILRAAFSFRDPLRYSEHRAAEGEASYREACRKGWEGIIAKLADSLYMSGRSTDWLKFKCESEQEFVIIGYTEPAGSRIGIGAILVGVYERSKLVYAGKVGTGFDTDTLRDLERKLSRIERSTPPVSYDSSRRTGVHWVQPKWVAQIAFTEWTDAGKLRHPRYVGLRADKKPSEVVREKAAEIHR